MERKLSIWILVGKGRGSRYLEPFSELSEHFDLNAAVFLDDLKNSDLITNINIRTYVEDPHLDGYLFGVEKDLVSADLLIVSDFNGEVAKQVTDYCSYSKKPFIYYLQKSDLYCSGETIFKVEDQKKVLLLASGFIVSDKEAEESLDFLGISKDLTYYLRPGMYVEKYSYQESLRDKFRNYVKICKDEFLVLCEGVQGFEKGALDLMKAARIYLNRYPEMQTKLKILFTGESVESTCLHHMAIDLNLVKNVLILSQDIDPFKRDIYSAADCIFTFPSERDDFVQKVAWDLFDAIGTGLDLMCHVGSDFAVYVRESYTYMPGDLKGMSDVLELLVQKNLLKECRSVRSENISYYSSRLHPEMMLEQFSTFLKGVLNQGFSEFNHFQANSSFSVIDLKARISGKSYEDAISDIDALIESQQITSDDKVRVILLKGQLCLRSGLLENAMDCFEISTSCDLTEREAYLGLGDVALRSFSNDEALSFYRKALAIKPNDAEALAGLGNVYRKAGMPEEAVKWLGQSLLVDSESSLVLKNFAQSALEAGDSEYVIEWLEKLRIYVGEQPALIMALGQLYYRVGENEKGGKLVSAALDCT